jgi:hypothetical protein
VYPPYGTPTTDTLVLAEVQLVLDGYPQHVRVNRYDRPDTKLYPATNSGNTESLNVFKLEKSNEIGVNAPVMSVDALLEAADHSHTKFEKLEPVT